MKTRLCPKAMVSAAAGLLVSPVFLFAQSNVTAGATHTSRSIESTHKSVPFREVIQRATGHRVLTFDTNNSSHIALREKLLEAAALAGDRALNQGLFADRPNEASRQMGAIVRTALRDAGLDTRTPGKDPRESRRRGYPDVEIRGDAPCYLEVKTYNASSEKGTDSSFQYAPGPNRRISRDALHFVLSYQLERSVQDGRQSYVPIRWRLISLEQMAVEVRTEFHQHNRHLYCEQNPQALLAERPVR